MAEGGQVMRKKAPAFTVDNIVAALRGLESKWEIIGIRSWVPRATLNHVRTKHSTNGARLREVLHYILSLHPYPGWRVIIWCLHCIWEQESAARIQEYAEPVTDTSLSVGSVAAVMSMMKRRWYELSPGGGNSLALKLDVPQSKWDEFRQQQHQSQQLKALATYCVDLLPGFSWSTLAGALYYCEEEAALQAARRYIKREEDPTLTMENLLSALQPVTDWKLLGLWLDVPESRRDKMTGKEEMLQHWLLHHPCRSWKVVAYALYMTRERRVLKQLYGKYVTGPEEIHRRLNACRQAIKQKGAIDQIIMQGVFFGLPRSGKTSTKKRLVGKKPARQQASTGVAEKVTRVEIEKTTVYTWNEVTELSEETAIVVEDIADHVTASTNKGASVNKSKSVHHQPAAPVATNIPAKQIGRMKLKSDAPSESRLRLIVRKVKAMFVKESIPQLTALGSALQVAPAPSIRQRHQREWTVYLSDAGGQPEFQEMLPALVSGPSIYFLTFPLHKGLNERFFVEYQHPNGSSIVPFETTLTMKEVLLQSVASIASTQSYTRVDDGKCVPPKILFIATHKDKVESEEKLLEIDQQLQDITRKTSAFKENMIVFYSEQQMIFALNNVSDDDEDIQHVRDAVERIGTTSDAYKIQTPCTWMIFAITLRHLPERVLSIDQCVEIGKECGIDTLEELNNALWFLHHNVGILRHFQDHPELQDTVIKEPQYIFDKVTELIVDTFTFDKVGPYLHQEFSNKGIFLADRITMLSTGSDTLTGDKFALLLEHLRILAPIEKNEDGKVMRYFVPAALAHADLPPDTQSQSLVPPLLVVFECGFCPKGMFGSLVVNLLAKDKRSQFEWTLEEDRVYRDQLCLSIGPYDSFQFSVSSTYVKVAVNSTTHEPRKVPLGRVCCDVRQEIDHSIQTVTEILHYTHKAGYFFAFACPEPPPHDQSHAATIKFSPEQEPCTMICPFNNKRYDLPEGHLLWFDENLSLKVETDGEKTSSHNQSGDIPSMLELTSFHCSNGSQVNIAVEVSINYTEFGAQLLHDPTGARVRNIERAKLKDPKEINTEILREWLRGGERQPVTWTALAKVLDDIGKGELAATVRQMKSHTFQAISV